MKRLLVATSNRHKVEEIAAMLGTGWQVESLQAHPQVQLPEETGSTFAANAQLKAEAASRHLPELWVLADDSGLEVDALGGRPGVYSARFAGPGANDAQNRARLKEELAALRVAGDVGPWSGRFCCALVLARGGRMLECCEGRVEGRLLELEQGAGGFGYDSMFVPQGHEQSFGLLSAEIKNALSHRARALAALLPKLQALTAS